MWHNVVDAKTSCLMFLSPTTAHSHLHIFPLVPPGSVHRLYPFMHPHHWRFIKMLALDGTCTCYHWWILMILMAQHAETDSNFNLSPKHLSNGIFIPNSIQDRRKIGKEQEDAGFAASLLTFPCPHLCWRNLVATVTVYQQPDAIIIQQQGLPEEIQQQKTKYGITVTRVRSVKTS